MPPKYKWGTKPQISPFFRTMFSKRRCHCTTQRTVANQKQINFKYLSMSILISTTLQLLLVWHNTVNLWLFLSWSVTRQCTHRGGRRDSPRYPGVITTSLHPAICTSSTSLPRDGQAGSQLETRRTWCRRRATVRTKRPVTHFCCL